MSVAIIIYLLRTQLELLFVLSQRTRCVPLILRYILLRFLDNCITSSFHTSKYLLSLTKKCLNYRREIKKKTTPEIIHTSCSDHLSCDKTRNS